YTAKVSASGGRSNGHVRSSDGILDLDIRKPVEMGGPGDAPNPEQLFAAAWGSCFLGALAAVSEKSGVDASEAKVDVHVSFNQDGNAFQLSARLDVHIPGIDADETQKLAEQAHRTCPYSKATRGNIDVSINALP